MKTYEDTLKEATQSVQWGNEDIEIYYQFLQLAKPTGFTICPVYSHQGDNNYYSRYDLIQLKIDDDNKYSIIPQFIELKGRNDYSYTQFDSARIDLSKVEELQEYGKTNNMDVFIVNIWKKDNNAITIHKLDLDKQYNWTWVYANKQTADTKGRVEKIEKKMVDLPFSEGKIYPLWYLNKQKICHN